MRAVNQHLSRFYDHILRLYPAGFQQENAEEMHTVFQMQLGNRPLSFWGSVWIAWDELRPLPGLLLSAHWRERKKFCDENRIGTLVYPA